MLVLKAHALLSRFSETYEFTIRSIYKQGNEITILAKRRHHVVGEE